jgi:V/A-type H+-transporting ATPase subunit E
MEKISKAVVDKVKAEAQSLIEEAEKEAQGEIDKAKKQREIKLEEKKRRMLAEAEEEAARIIAQGSIKGRQKVSSTKADIIDKIIERVKKTLSETASDKNHLLSLIEEAMNGLGTDKGRIYVSPKDIDAVQVLLKGNKELSSKIEEVKEFDCTGGVIAEDIEGKFRIDNTYETRLEMLLPKLLPEMNKELFEVGV